MNTYIELDEVRIHIRDWGGSGPDLFMIPGNGARAETFDSLASHLRSRFRVIAMTRRGVVPSSQPKSGYDIATLMADVISVLNALKIKSAHLVGHSLGGVEITELARIVPERVLSLVYLDAVPNGIERARLIAKHPLMETIESLELLPQYETIEGQIDSWYSKYAPDFRVLHAPVLALFALQSKDPDFPSDLSEELRQKADNYWTTEVVPTIERLVARFRREVPHSKVVVMAEASHSLYIDRESEVVKCMNKFYDQILPRVAEHDA